MLEGSNEHPTDVIAHYIDILLEAQTEPEGYEKIIEGHDQYNNCTERDKIILQDKCMYLIAALSKALKHYPATTWRKCWEDASEACSLITTSGKTIEEWWIMLRENKYFLHPRGAEAMLPDYKKRLPFFP